MRKPDILLKSELAERVHFKLDEIATCLAQSRLNYNSPSGLFSGYAGISLFLFYYSRYCKNDYYADVAGDFLTLALDNLNLQDYTFCNGVCGVCWCVNHLIEEGFIDNNNFDILNHFDKYLCEQTFFDLEKGQNVDFLHGSIGNALYLLKRAARTGVKEFFEGLLTPINNAASVTVRIGFVVTSRDLCFSSSFSVFTTSNRTSSLRLLAL